MPQQCAHVVATAAKHRIERHVHKRLAVKGPLRLRSVNLVKRLRDLAREIGGGRQRGEGVLQECTLLDPSDGRRFKVVILLVARL